MTASVTSTERLQRLLALVPYVVSRKSVGLAETAAAFGVTERELVDDLNLLWCVELRAPDPYCPIDLSYEGGEIVVSQAESMARPLRLAVDEATERDVDPMRLLVVEGRPYLEGWCLRAEGMRTFRLDRVLALDVLDVPASPPPEATPVDVDQGLFRPSPDDVHVVLELSAAGRWVAENYPCESVTELTDGRLQVVLSTPDTGWVRRLALQLGEDGRVVSPPSLVTEVRDAATAALANYVVLSAAVRCPPRGTCGN